MGLAIATTPRDEPHDPGQIRWWRWPLALGLTYRLSSAAVHADLSAGPVAAWLHLVGSAFDTNYTQDALTWGAHATLTAGGRSRPWAPFGLLNLQVYPANATAYVTLIEQRWPIPKWSLGGLLGVRLSD